jgi:predicted XRE-type DNA-binding protein
MSFTHSKRKAKKRRSATSSSRRRDFGRSSTPGHDVQDIAIIESSGNVFADVGLPPAEATNLHLRSQLMIELRRLIEERRLTQMQAAKLFGVSQPRISNLMRGKIDMFSLDHLITIAARAGAVIRLSIDRSAA